MIMYRYLAFVWNSQDTGSTLAVAALESAIVATAPWDIAYRSAGVLVAYQPTRPHAAGLYYLSDNRGVVLGSLFRRVSDNYTPGQLAGFDGAETRRILESSCSHLVAQYWGSYVAII